MMKTTWIALALVGLAAPAAAQGVVTPVPPPASESQVTFAARAAVQARITRGAPYSAETTTESVQVLANGTRIAHKSVARLYRDAEGRTRTEQLSDGGEVESVTISDPVQGASYVLNPKTRVAYRTGVIVATPSGTAIATVSPGSTGTITTTQTADGRVSIAASSGSRGRGGAAAGGFVGGGTGGGSGRGAVTARARGSAAPETATGNTTREDLGQQTIEGVAANGTRTTTVLPAGSIGNDQPIEIVSEQWFSPDLEVLVLTKHSDPRVGDTTFRMTGIVRAAPASALFEVPSDYRLEQSFIRRDISR
jgi:hypothetical protein